MVIHQVLLVLTKYALHVKSYDCSNFIPCDPELTACHVHHSLNIALHQNGTNLLSLHIILSMLLSLEQYMLQSCTL